MHPRSPSRLCTRPKAPLLGVLAFVTACSGNIDGGTPVETVGGDRPTTPPGTTRPPAQPSQTMPPGTPSTPGDAPVGTFRAQRLSQAQYTRAVRWLFADATLEPTQPLSPEEGSESGFPQVARNMGAKDARDFRDAAESIAARVVPSLRALSGCDPATLDSAAGQTCFGTYIKTLGRRAFRRPLSDAELADYTALYAGARQNAELDAPAAAGVVIAAVLQAPQFLYRWETTAEPPVRQGGAIALNRYQVASRLAFLLSGAPPDDELNAEVDTGKLTTTDDVVRVTNRYLARAETATRLYGDFHVAWLDLAGSAQLRKDAGKYPFWDLQTSRDLEGELRAYLDAVLVKGDGKLRTVLTAPFAMANEKLAPIYGVKGISGATFQRIDLDASRRKGVLMQAAFLAATGSEDGSLPPRRGNRILRRVLCGQTLAVPMNVPDLPAPKAGQTTRQRFEDQHDRLDCAKGCHGIIDPIGFAFEGFGGAGELRETDNGQPVNESGHITTPAGTAVDFRSGVELVDRLSQLDEVQRCAATQWFRYVMERRELDEERAELDRLTGAFTKADTRLADLLRALVASRTFRFRQPFEGETL